tara:strand:+ start:3127 stop:4191 length:1065 start_codon:yes stop_codon:yes gene_type:complete
MLKIKKKWLNKVKRVKNEVKNRHRFLRLDKNEKIENFSYDLWKKFLESLHQNDFQAYPQVEELYTKLSKKIKINRNNLFLSSGSDNSIRNFFEIFTNTKSKVITSNPCFPMYKVYSKINKNKLIYIKYDKNLKLNLKDFNKKISSKIDAIIIANPNSPIGDLIKEKELKKIIIKSNKYGIPFFLDQAYYEFSNTNMIGLVKKFDNLIISRTFSKGMGAAGVRLAYIIANKKIINLFEKVRPLYEINQIAVKYGLFILSNYNLARNYCKKTMNSRNKLCKVLNKNKINAINSETNSIHIRFDKNLSKVIKIFRKFRVLFKFSSLPNSNYKQWVRLTVFPGIEKERFIEKILLCQK